MFVTVCLANFSYNGFMVMSINITTATLSVTKFRSELEKYYITFHFA